LQLQNSENWKKINDANNNRQPESADEQYRNRLLPHEYLYLMANADDRFEAFAALNKTRFSIKKVDLAFNYEDL